MSGSANKVAQLRAQDEQRRLSREELLSVHRVEEEFFVKGLGGTVMLQSLTHRERQEIRQKAQVGTPEYDESLLEMLSIVNAVKDPVLTLDDVEKLRDQDSTIIDELTLEISMMNMMGREQHLGKVSRTAQSPDSQSDSQNDSE